MTKNQKITFGIVALAGMATCASAACILGFLDRYLDDPHSVTAPGQLLANTQLALVKIKAVHEKLPQGKTWSYTATGTLDLQKIDSNGDNFPKKISVAYKQRRGVLIDCETWDMIQLKRGEVLLVFVRNENGNWVIPEAPTTDVVSDVITMSPQLRAKVQPCFKTQLSSFPYKPPFPFQKF